MSSIQQHVTVYTTQLCAYCRAQKRFLSEHNISFTEVEVDNDTVAAEAMNERSGQMSVPYTVITDDAAQTEEEIMGFDRVRLTKILGIEAYDRPL